MLRTLLIGIILAGAIAIAIGNPFGALMAYQWYAYFRPEEWVWIDISAFRFSLVLGTILILRCLASGVWPTLNNRFSVGIVAFLMTGIVAQVNAVRPDIGWQWIDYFARLALVSLLIITLVNTPRRLFYASLVIALSLGLRTAKVGLTSLMQGGVQIAYGHGGSFVDNNGFGLACVMIMPLLWGLSGVIPAEWRFRRAIAWSLRFATLFTAYAAVSTYSRGALLALGAGFLAYVLTMRRRRIATLAVVLVVGSIAAPFVTLPEGYTERMETITSYEEVGEDSALSRLHFWQVAWEMAKDLPLGIGMFNFQHLYDRYDFLHGAFGYSRAVHSSHFQVLAEHGFAGFIAWIGLFALAFLTCLRVRRLANQELAGREDAALLSSMSGAFIASMVAFLAGGAFINLALNEITWNTFALVAAMGAIAFERMPEAVGAAPNRPAWMSQDEWRRRHAPARIKA